MSTDIAAARYVKESFERDTSYINDRITRDGSDEREWPVESGRYRLVVARACPWANRALITRRLLGLEEALSMGITGPIHDSHSWKFDLDPGDVDPVLGIHRLKEAYEARFPGYPKGITVPAILEIESGEVVTNDFKQMVLDFSTEWTDHHRDGEPELFPEDRREGILEVADVVYRDVNDGVYNAGFAGSQRDSRARRARGVSAPKRHSVEGLAVAHSASSWSGPKETQAYAA